jgi:hypothetical protein
VRPQPLPQLPVAVMALVVLLLLLAEWPMGQSALMGLTGL